MDSVSFSLSSDAAEVDPSKDLLGYAPFAKYLAKSIAGMTPQNGIVIGIYAPWGSGKTTLLNFVLSYLEAQQGGNKTVVVPFNPWWFSGQDDLARSFFNEFLVALDKQDKLAPLRTKLASYAELLGAIPVYGAAAKAGAQILKPAEKSLRELKIDVSSALGELDGKILVVIDDIDRLTAEETRQLFRVVKAVADFPNVVYLLAFDRSIAAKALETIHVGDGHSYLEKIIQVPFELPMPDSASLEKMLLDRLNAVMNSGVNQDVTAALFNQSHWSSTYRVGIAPFIETPRDIVRLTNTLSVTYPAVSGEVNPVDFIAIETLRVFLPDVYDVIRNNIRMFAGSEQVERWDIEGFKTFHVEWLEQVPSKQKNAVRGLILRLFPRTRSAWERDEFSGSSVTSSPRMRNIAEEELFPIYFRLALPSNDLSHAEVHRIIANLSDADAFCADLLALQKRVRPDNISFARRFLEKLEGFTNELPVTKIPMLIRGLFDAGDRLLQREQERVNTFLDLSLRLQMSRIFFQLASRLPESQRFETLKETMIGTSSYATVTTEISLMGQSHSKYGSQSSSMYEQVCTSEELAELEIIALNKIRTMINLNDFTGEQKLRYVLYVWSEVGSAEEVGKWLTEAISQDDGLVKVLTQFISVTSSQSSDEANTRQTNRLDPLWLAAYLDPSALRSRIEGLATRTDLTSKETTAILQFLQEYEDRESGLRPDDVMYSPRSSVYERLGRMDLYKNARPYL